MPEPFQVWSLLVQIPITGIVIWVFMRLLARESQERKAFMEAMAKTDELFTAELRSERESRERLTTKTYETLSGLALAISELRGEVRTSSGTNHKASQR